MPRRERGHPFVAVVINCLDDEAKTPFLRYDFTGFLCHPMNLILPEALTNHIDFA